MVARGACTLEPFRLGYYMREQGREAAGWEPPSLTCPPEAHRAPGPTLSSVHTPGRFLARLAWDSKSTLPILQRQLLSPLSALSSPLTILLTIIARVITYLESGLHLPSTCKEDLLVLKKMATWVPGGEHWGGPM